MTITPEQFAKKVNQLATELERAPREGVARAGKLAFASVQAQLAADIGPERQMSGLGNRRVRASGGGPVSARLRLSRSGKEPSAWIGPSGKGSAGAFGILEGGTVAHVTGGKTSSKIARRGRKKDGTVTYNRVRNPKSAGRVLMATPWGPRWGPFVVGGSRPKRTVSKAWRRVERQAAMQLRLATRSAVGKAFK